MSGEQGHTTREIFEQFVEQGEAEGFGEHRFVAMLTLGSGARYGLADGACWAVVDGQRLTLFGPSREKAFVEALEYGRDEFDARLEAGAQAQGFDGQQVMFSFPAVELVQAMLVSGSPHFTRLALAWLRPTEIRAAREQLVALTADKLLPQATRDFAARLIVPAD